MSMGMGIGVRAGSARVGVVPTSSGSSSAASRRRASGGSSNGGGTYGVDSDSDLEDDGDSSTAPYDLPHGPSKSNSKRSTSTATATSNFMQIPVKNAELKDKLRALGASNHRSGAASATNTTTGSARGGVAVGSGSATRSSSFVLPSQRRKQEQRDKRRSSVLLSLAMLDVPDDDDDGHLNSFHDNGGNNIESAIPAEANEKAHVGAPLHTTEPKGRYLRRGSVTKHQLVANVDAMQPSVHTPRTAAPYLPDSSHNTHPSSHSDLPARADYELDDIDVNTTGYASDSYGYTSDASVSNSHSATTQRRRQSSAATLGNATAPPLTSQNGRYLRRGNVTRHKLNPPVGTMQPTHHRSLDRSENYDHDKDDSSVVSMPPLSSSASFSSQSTDALPPRQKYHRRGSVTKFSLDSYLQNPAHTKGLQGEGKNSSSSNANNVDYGYNTDDNDNGSVVSMPPLSSSASYSQSKDALPPRQKYHRRGSVTKFSLDSYLQNPGHTKGLQGEGKDSSSRNANVDYGNNTDDNDNGSVVSMPPLLYSQSTDALPPKPKYHRRGSVTKFSLDSYLQNPAHTKGLQGEGKNSSSSKMDYGYNTDDNDNGSVVSMPPLSSTSSFSKSTDALPPKAKYHRRGSVTKFSLEASQPNPSHAAALQPYGAKETNQVASSLPAPLTAKSNHNDSDTDSDSDSDKNKRPKPKPGDDDYSENLENSGRFARRSISISLEADDIQPNVFTDSKRPPLPRAHSASSALPGIKPKKKLLAPQGGIGNTSGVDTNGIQIRMTNEPVTQSPPKNSRKSALEDDSGHVKKSWYSQTPPSVTRRDSMSSLDSESSDAEFGAEIVDTQPKQRSPPRLPPHNKARVMEASKLNDSISKEPTNEKTTIDGKFLNLASSSFDDIASTSGHSDDDDDDAEIQSSRKKPLRARRSSIVGIPSSNDAGYTSLDDTSSNVDRDEGMATPRPTKMRARRSSIIGIPTIDPASPPSNSPSNDDAKEKMSKTKPTSSASQETTKPKKKATSKSKLSSTKIKKSVPDTVLDSGSSIGSVPTSERRGCLKSENGTGIPKKVRFGHLVITEFPIILGDNPAVTSGAPVTIDWTPQKETSLSINAYEQCKPRRRRRRKLLISVSNRAILLLAAGYSIDEIADASIDAQQIKLGRQQTLDNQSWDRINHMLETTGDAIGGILLQPLQITGKKLKSLVVKPQQQTTSARMA